MMPKPTLNFKKIQNMPQERFPCADHEARLRVMDERVENLSIITNEISKTLKQISETFNKLNLDFNMNQRDVGGHAKQIEDLTKMVSDLKTEQGKQGVLLKNHGLLLKVITALVGAMSLLNAEPLASKLFSVITQALVMK